MKYGALLICLERKMSPHFILNTCEIPCSLFCARKNSQETNRYLSDAPGIELFALSRNQKVNTDVQHYPFNRTRKLFPLY